MVDLVHSIPAWQLGIIVVGVSIVLSGLGLVIVHRLVPVDERRPHNDIAGYISNIAAFVASLESALDREAMAHPNPGRTPVHRLNRAEYSNAVRDLLGVDVHPGYWLPVDDSGYGFDNIGAVLSTSPALLDRYMSAAYRVSRLAIGDLTQKPVEEIYDAKRDPSKGTRNERFSDELPFDSRAGIVAAYYFPLDADYVFKIRVLGVQADGEQAETDPYQLRLAVKAGLHSVGVTSPRENLKPERDAPVAGPGPGQSSPNTSSQPRGNGTSRMK